MRRPNLKMVVFLLIVTTLCTLFLSFVNRFYQKGIALQQRELRVKILQAFNVVFGEEDFDKVFNESIDIVEDPRGTFYIYRGAPLQAALLLSGSGLWSVIELLLFVNEDTKTVTELKVLTQAETPGLGARIEEDAFLDQFKGLDYSEEVKVVVEKKGEPGEVDAISGATKTSQSVQVIINDGIDTFRSILEEMR
jgi:RnfABCDGE-type electron transport complex G subunit